MRSLDYIEDAEKRQCEYEPCGRIFYLKSNLVNVEPGRFCSMACFRYWQKENKGKIKYSNSPVEKLSNPNAELHRYYANKWQKENPEKAKAQSIAKYHKDKLVIIYECPCDYPTKQNHHFDYEFPLLVIKLCPACHSAEHKRLRSQTNEAVAI